METKRFKVGKTVFTNYKSALKFLWFNIKNGTMTEKTQIQEV